jgi:hypothetical protein
VVPPPLGDVLVIVLLNEKNRDSAIQDIDKKNHTKYKRKKNQMRVMRMRMMRRRKKKKKMKNKKMRKKKKKKKKVMMMMKMMTMKNCGGKRRRRRTKSNFRLADPCQIDSSHQTLLVCQDQTVLAGRMFSVTIFVGSFGRRANTPPHQFEEITSNPHPVFYSDRYLK